MVDKISLATGIVMIIVGASLSIASVFILPLLIYGLPILILGIIILVTLRQQDAIEQIKSSKKEGGVRKR